MTSMYMINCNYTYSYVAKPRLMHVKTILWLLVLSQVELMGLNSKAYLENLWKIFSFQHFIFKSIQLQAKV